MRARRVAVIVAALALSGTTSARADDEVHSGAYVDERGDPGGEAAELIDLPGGRAGGGGADDDGCEWRVIINDDTEVGVFNAEGDRLFSETGRWFAEVCDGDALFPLIGALPLTPEGGLVDPGALALEARDTVPIGHPAIHTSPDGDRRLYTQVPTWLWVDDSWWQPYSVTVTAGNVETTVTAHPVRAVWDTGDGEVTTCDGPGVAWHRGMSDDATYCKHTYRHSSSMSPTGTYRLQVTIEFDVSWTSNVGVGGTLAGVSRTASRDVAVGEIQAIES